MNLSSTPTQPTSVLSTIVAGWRQLRAILRPARLRGHITYSSQPSTPAQANFVLGVIDDPDQSMRLLSVRGGLTADSIRALTDAFAEIPNGAMLHLDLTDVEFANAIVITRLGALLDTLEDRNVRVRIVGLGSLAAVRLD